MNWKRKSNWQEFSVAAAAIAAVVLASSGMFGARIANAAAGKGLDIEIAYEIKALKIAGATSPVYVQADKGKLIFSDASGAVMSAPMGGGTRDHPGEGRQSRGCGDRARGLRIVCGPGFRRVRFR